MPKFSKLLFISAISLCQTIPCFSQSRLPDLPASNDRISSQGQVVIKEFVFEGNTIFTDAQLSDIAVPYTNTSIAIEKIHELRNKITKLYIEAGYINSGVVVKDQTVADGILTMTVIEGTILKINVNGNPWLRDHYILSRIQKGITSPVNIFELQKPLQLMQQDPLIKTIHAQLIAGVKAGEGILDIEVVEEKPYQLGIIANNYRSPGTGSYFGEVYGSYSNLSGWGETIGGSYGLTEGADDFTVHFSLPLTRRNTVFSASYQESDSTIVTDVFRDLDIDSESEIFNLTLHQPLYHTLHRELSLFVSLDRKKSETFILSRPNSFSEGVENGVSKISVLNFGQEFVDRSADRVIALRSNLGFGVDWLGARYGGDPPDGGFVTWAGQFQILQKLPFWNSQLLVRANGRLADDRVPPLEKYGVGGRYTVRGYRQNELTNDNGFIGGVEFRVPLGKVKVPGISKSADDGEIKLIPFFDYGSSWAKNNDEINSKRIYSVGLGLRWDPGETISAEFFWGHQLNNVSSDDDYDLQDDGIHLQISAALF